MYIIMYLVAGTLSINYMFDMCLVIINQININKLSKKFVIFRRNKTTILFLDNNLKYTVSIVSQ